MINKLSRQMGKKFNDLEELSYENIGIDAVQNGLK